MTATGPIERTCHLCESTHAPFGFGEPGRPTERQAMPWLWACPRHREDVDRINDERLGRARVP